MSLKNEKNVWIKINMEDYGYILKAYGLAVNSLLTQYPKPKRGKEQQWKKQQREENYKLSENFIKSQNRFLKTCRETMKNDN